MAHILSFSSWKGWTKKTEIQICYPLVRQIYSLIPLPLRGGVTVLRMNERSLPLISVAVYLSLMPTLRQNFSMYPTLGTAKTISCFHFVDIYQRNGLFLSLIYVDKIFYKLHSIYVFI